MKDHIYATKLDLGVLGERDVEVFYDWTPPNPSNDSFQAPENGGATVVAVILWLGGKEVDAKELLVMAGMRERNEARIAQIKAEMGEKYILHPSHKCGKLDTPRPV